MEVKMDNETGLNRLTKSRLKTITEKISSPHNHRTFKLENLKNTTPIVNKLGWTDFSFSKTNLSLRIFQAAPIFLVFQKNSGSSKLSKLVSDIKIYVCVFFVFKYMNGYNLPLQMKGNTLLQGPLNFFHKGPD